MDKIISKDILKVNIKLKIKGMEIKLIIEWNEMGAKGHIKMKLNKIKWNFGKNKIENGK